MEKDCLVRGRGKMGLPEDRMVAAGWPPVLVSGNSELCPSGYEGEKRDASKEKSSTITLQEESLVTRTKNPGQ